MDARPDIKEFYSWENIKSIEKISLLNPTDSKNKIELVCPRCRKRHAKRLDAVLRSGAYCNSCSRIISMCENSQSVSLSDYSSKLAEMYDRGNNTIPSSLITIGSSSESNFVCDNGGIPHMFKKSVAAMVNAYNNGNLGCPVCAGFEVRVGINDFKSKNPTIAIYWDYEGNYPIKPEDVYYRSEERYKFVCKYNHSFNADPLHLMRSIGTSTLGCPVCHGKQIVVGDNDLATRRPDIINYWDWGRNLLNPEEVSEFSNKLAWFYCSSCGKSYESAIDIRSMTDGKCENCRENNSWFKAEKELAGFLKSKGFIIKENVYFHGIELDILIESKGIAIEYNGLYWHSEIRRADPNYHYNKYKICKEHGIKLIFVWEDDYLLKRDLVLTSLLRKLGSSEEVKINARDCIVQDVSNKEAMEFSNKNHIQGFVSGTLYKGLYSKNSLVALAIFTVSEDTLILSRYCSNCLVRGGFTKLLSSVNSLGYRGVLTFSDNGISDGSLYKNNGFKFIGELKPDYCYYVGGKRVHKFNYRKERFKKDPKLLYEEGLSERELAILNKIPRIWDSGKCKWYKEF